MTSARARADRALDDAVAHAKSRGVPAILAKGVAESDMAVAERIRMLDRMSRDVRHAADTLHGLLA